MEQRQNKFFLLMAAALLIVMLVQGLFLFASSWALLLVAQLAYRQTMIRELRESLAISEETYRQIFDNGSDALMIHDAADGRILDVNRVCCEAYGYSREEYLKMTIQDFSPEKDGFTQDKAVALLSSVFTDGPKSFEWQVLKRDGTCIWAEVTIKGLLIGGERRVLAACRDVTERKRAHEEQERLFEQETLARQAAEEALKMRDEFLSIASHELRTPLTPLRLQLSALKRQIDRGDIWEMPHDAAKKLVAGSEAQLNRLVRLIEELLDVSRLTRGQFTLKPQSMDLAELLRDVAERSAVDLERARCKMELRVPDSMSGQWDRMRLEQVIVNLLSNSMKYAAGSPIQLSLERVGENAVVRVRDGGMGIKSEDLSRIFQRFERAAPGHSYPGLGLGLYISSEIIKAHRGAIRAESVEGAGAEFTVELPIA